MLSGIPSLNHEEQQEAVDKIHQLMAEGISSGQAIAIVAQQLRETHQGKEQIVALFDDEDEEIKYEDENKVDDEDEYDEEN